MFYIFFFFSDPSTTEIYTLSLHDALPISHQSARFGARAGLERGRSEAGTRYSSARRALLLHASRGLRDRKSTRLNSSHLGISYAVFCLKKKKKHKNHDQKAEK